MKIIILQHSEGEYDWYDEIIDEILMVNEDFPDVNTLYHTTYNNHIGKKYEEFKENYLKTHKKFSDQEWTKYWMSNKLDFSSWIKKNYMTTSLPFDRIVL